MNKIEELRELYFKSYGANGQREALYNLAKRIGMEGLVLLGESKMEYLKLKIKVDEQPSNEIDNTKLININADTTEILFINNYSGIVKRAAGEFKNKAFFLPKEYDWVLGKDNVGEIVLIPLKQ